MSKRLCCVCGLIGGLLFLSGDYLFYGALTSGRDLHTLAIMTSRQDWQLLLGGALGPVAGLFYAAGMGLFYLTLRSVNQRLAAAAALSLAAMVLVGGAYHAVFTAYGFVGRVQDVAERQRLIAEIGALYDWISWVAYALGGVGTLMVITLALNRRSDFPKWMLPILPTILAGLCLIVTAPFEAIPAPLGGLIRGGRINGSFILFFALATWFFWRTSDDPSPAVDTHPAVSEARP